MIEKASIVKDFVFAANDGILTTFAVVAGAYGANLSPKIVIVLGIANLLADGISMASGNYIGTKSEEEMLHTHRAEPVVNPRALKHSITTFFSFIIGGVFPLIPYFLGTIEPRNFYFSLLLMVTTLSILGYARSHYTKRGPIGSIVETLVIGGAAAFAAYLVGSISAPFLME